MIDAQKRTVDYLRISITDACNLRCIYCMPEHPTFRPSINLLTNAEILRLVRLFTEFGFTRFRLTGGEPTIRDDLPGMLQSINDINHVKEVLLTTNGINLAGMTRSLIHAGLKRVNINLCALDATTYRLITRGGSFKDVWDGIMTAHREGLGIKLNAVILKHFNDDETPIKLARLTLKYPWHLRFIEAMPVGCMSTFQKQHVVTEADIKTELEKHIGALTIIPTSSDSRHALYQLPHASGYISFISPHSQPFCSSCNRARLTADGCLRTCLLHDDETALMTPMRNGASDNELKELIYTTFLSKPFSHQLADGHYPRRRMMSEIGG